MEIEDEPVEQRKRKSLAIDKETYDLLRDICAKERRSLIHQLQHMHQQAALMRLMSRNLMIEVDGGALMGYDLGYEVEGAMIVAREVEPEPLDE